MIRRAANRKWNKKIRIADPLWSSGPLGLAKDKTRIYFNIESAGKSKQSTLLINISFRRPPTKHEHPAFRPTHLQTAFGVALVLQKSRREEAVASRRTPRLSESLCQKLFSSVTQAGKRMDRNHLRAIHSQAFCVVMFVQLSTPGNALGYKAPGSSRKKTHPAGRRYGSTKFRICQEHCWFIATRCYKYIIAHSRDYRMIYIYISQSQGANPSPKLPAVKLSAGLSAGARCTLFGWHHLCLPRIDYFFRLSWRNASWVTISNQERRLYEGLLITASIIKLNLYILEQRNYSILSTQLHVSKERNMTLSRRKAICSVLYPAWIVGAHLRDTSFQLEGRVAAQLLSHGFVGKNLRNFSIDLW